jgi:hypothetical protein
MLGTKSRIAAAQIVASPAPVLKNWSILAEIGAGFVDDRDCGGLAY